MTPHFRKIEAGDVAKLFVVRSSVRENPFSVEGLAKIGITPKSVVESLGNGLDGYLCEMSGRIVGLCDG